MCSLWFCWAVASGAKTLSIGSGRETAAGVASDEPTVECGEAEAEYVFWELLLGGMVGRGSMCRRERWSSSKVRRFLRGSLCIGFAIDNASESVDDVVVVIGIASSETAPVGGGGTNLEAGVVPDDVDVDVSCAAAVAATLLSELGELEGESIDRPYMGIASRSR